MGTNKKCGKNRETILRYTGYTLDEAVLWGATGIKMDGESTNPP